MEFKPTPQPWKLARILHAGTVTLDIIHELDAVRHRVIAKITPLNAIDEEDCCNAVLLTNANLMHTSLRQIRDLCKMDNITKEYIGECTAKLLQEIEIKIPNHKTIKL